MAAKCQLTPVELERLFLLGTALGLLSRLAMASVLPLDLESGLLGSKLHQDSELLEVLGSAAKEFLGSESESALQSLETRSAPATRSQGQQTALASEWEPPSELVLELVLEMVLELV